MRPNGGLGRLRWCGMRMGSFGWRAGCGRPTRRGDSGDTKSASCEATTACVSPKSIPSAARTYRSPGFERPALLFDAANKKFKLYACGPWRGGPWSIIKFDDAASPDQFIANTAKPVIQPQTKTYERDIRPSGYKDPVILHAEGRYHAYVIGEMRRTERIYHFTSDDGEKWSPVGSPFDSIMHLDGWHDFYVRPASVLPLEFGYLFIYEGSNTKWRDPVYNMGTGVAFTFDLHNIQELTTTGPLAISSTPSENFHTFRYSHWMHVGDELWVYAEVVRPDDAHEIRLFRLPKLSR